jgi:hypothetical protein
MVRVRRLAALAGAVLALGAHGFWVPASFAASSTTAPGKNVRVYFVIDDKQIRYQIYRETAGGGASDLYLEKYVLRGDYASFFVINRGKKQHGFAFMGKKFAELRPGHRAHFNRALLVRGSFPYRSTTDRGKLFKGVFRVY